MKVDHQQGEAGVENPHLTTSAPVDAERIRAPQVATLTGLSTKTVKARGLDGKHDFPRGIILPDAGMVFVRAEIIQWMAAQEELTERKREAIRDARRA